MHMPWLNRIKLLGARICQVNEVSCLKVLYDWAYGFDRVFIVGLTFIRRFKNIIKS